MPFGNDPIPTNRQELGDLQLRKGESSIQMVSSFGSHLGSRFRGFRPTRITGHGVHLFDHLIKWRLVGAVEARHSSALSVAALLV
jgi:hypothetical protein